MLAVILEFSAVKEEAVSLTGYPSREELTVWLVCLTFCFPFTNEPMSCRKSFQIPPSWSILILPMCFISWNGRIFSWCLVYTGFVYFFTHSVKWTLAKANIRMIFIPDCFCVGTLCYTACFLQVTQIRSCECWIQTVWKWYL